MNTAIVFIDKCDQQGLAKSPILDKTLLDYTIDHLKKAGSDNLIVVSKEEVRINDVMWLDNVKDLDIIIPDLDGKLILSGIHYPSITADVYYNLYHSSAQASVVKVNDEFVDIFMMPCCEFRNYAKLRYEIYNVEDADFVKVDSALKLVEFASKRRKAINHQHLMNGVNFIDIESTYIGEDVEIDKGVTLYPNTCLEGKTSIGSNTIITANSHLINATIGSDCKILSSRVSDSIIHDKVSVGPYSHLRMNCDISDNCRIGNFVEFKNAQFGKGSKSAHLTYIGDSEVGQDVNIGCGVITVNYDGAHKYRTVIKDKAFIGSNANIIAPVTIGQQALVAAGSTVTRDVEDGAMAISRVRQEDKPGYGYRYITKEK